MILEEKQSLRAQMRRVLGAMDSGSKHGAGLEILQHLNAWEPWVNARSVCLFSALSDEPDVLRTWPTGKRIILPRVTGSTISLHFVEAADVLLPGAFGILEPPGDALESPPAADLILVPGIAFDRSGGRLGRGGGYYDRLLARFAGLRVGVCFEESVCRKIPRESHDVRMDFLATPVGIISCR